MPPTIVSPSINLLFALMNKRPLSKSSVNTTAVALEVCPVIVSPLSNFPYSVPTKVSKIILSPASSGVLALPKELAFNTKLFAWLVSVSNKIPSVDLIEVTDNSADSNNW